MVTTPADGVEPPTVGVMEGWLSSPPSYAGRTFSSRWMLGAMFATLGTLQVKEATPTTPVDDFEFFIVNLVKGWLSLSLVAFGTALLIMHPMVEGVQLNHNHLPYFSEQTYCLHGWKTPKTPANPEHAIVGQRKID